MKWLKAFIRTWPLLHIHILNLSLEIIQESAEIRNNEGLLTNDSLVVATMKKYNISKLITNDDDFDKINWIVRFVQIADFVV